jgi:transposase
MLRMFEIEDIRTMYFNKGKKVSEICELTGFDRKTVTKYLKTENFNKTNSKVSVCKVSKLSKYKAEISSWLEEDKKVRRKQRHTARRVYDRLREKYSDFNCSYRTVAKYVSEAKEEIYHPKNSYLPLEHKSGEAQVDFGKAEFIENGKRYFGSYLILSFPYSNAGYMQLFKGENLECLLQGLKNIYQHIGGVPYRQWFDNLSPVVKKVLKENGRQLTENFIRFKEHHKFEAVFCNVNAGHEKGNVENKVGYLRRNLLVPVPEFSDIDKYNKELFKRCEKDMNRVHYNKDKIISDLFEEDLRSLNPLPSEEFIVESYETVKVNSYGKFSLNKGRHIYSASPVLSGKRVTIAKTYNTIQVLDKEMKEVVVHSRLYGKEKQESVDWLVYFNQLSRKPRALKYTGIYKMLPDSIRIWLDRVSVKKQSSALKILASITKESGFKVAVKTLENALSYNVTDLDSIKSVYNVLTMNLPDFAKVEIASDIPEVCKVDSDVKKYDLFLSKGGDENVNC